MAHGDGLHFEVSAAQQTGYSNKLPSRQIFGEICFVSGVELVVVGKISAGDLDINEIVHSETGLSEKRFVGFEKIFDFVFDFFGGFAGLIETDVSRDVERVASENRATEGRLRRTVWQIDGAPLGSACRLAKEHREQ